MKTWLLPLAAAAALTGCVPRLVEKLPYYKLPVIQGVPLDAHAVASVRPGMSREQVTLQIGAPLLHPAFRNDRWDYVYEVSKGGKTKENQDLTVFFQDNTVIRVEGSALESARRQLETEGAKQ